MKKLLFLCAICSLGLFTVSCNTKSGETKRELHDSIVTADSLHAAQAVDSINAFNDSVTRAQSADSTETTK